MPRNYVPVSIAIIAVHILSHFCRRWSLVKKTHYRTNIEVVDKSLRPASALDTKPATN